MYEWSEECVPGQICMAVYSLHTPADKWLDGQLVGKFNFPISKYFKGNTKCIQFRSSSIWYFVIMISNTLCVQLVLFIYGFIYLYT